MKNGITDILNSLFSQPSDKPGLSLGQGQAAPKGSQPQVGSFEDVMAQLASQDGTGEAASGAPQTPSDDAQAPQVEAEVLPPVLSAENLPSSQVDSLLNSLTIVTHADFQITESITVQNQDQLVQAERSLTALASAMVKLVHELSSLSPQDADQVQKALVSLSGGLVTDDQAKAFADSFKTLTSKFTGSADPLTLSAAQQASLVNQAFQQMLQDQQFLFGSFDQSQGTPSGTAGQAFLQVSFSETQIYQLQQAGAQTSSLFIDMQSFQMSATFLQFGGTQTQAPQAPSFQVLPLSDSLRSALDQMVTTKLNLEPDAVSLPQQAGQAANAGTSTEDAGKNLKALVQMLFQAGASQAVLTSLVNGQAQPSSASAGGQGTSVLSMMQESVLQVSAAEWTSAGTSADGSGEPQAPSSLGTLFSQADVQTLQSLNETIGRLNVLSVSPVLADQGSGTVNKPSVTMDQLMALLNEAAPSLEDQPKPALSLGGLPLSPVKDMTSLEMFQAAVSVQSLEVIVPQQAIPAPLPAGLTPQALTPVVPALSNQTFQAAFVQTSASLLELSQTVILPAATDPLTLSVKPQTVLEVPVVQTLSASVWMNETQGVLTSQSQSPAVDPLPAAPDGGIPAAPVPVLVPQAVQALQGGDGLSHDLRTGLDLSKKTGDGPELPILTGILLPNPAQVLPNQAPAAANNNAGAQAVAARVDGFQVLDQITDQIKAHASEVKAVSRLSFQLVPESLGKVNIQIALVDQAVSARIVVSHPDVRESLQHHLVELKTALNQSGLQIDQLQVQVQGGSSNLLAQYYQYQREGSGGGNLSGSLSYNSLEEAKNLENSGVLANLSVRMSLVDVLA